VVEVVLARFQRSTERSIRHIGEAQIDHIGGCQLEWPRVLILRQRLFDFRQHLDPLLPRAQWIPKKSVDTPRTGQRPVPPTKPARQAGSAAILAAHTHRPCQRTFYNLHNSSAWLPTRGVRGV